MRVTFSFITAPHNLTRVSDVVEGATTESLQKAECVLPNARQDHVKKPVIPKLMKKAQSTARIAARSQMLPFDSQSSHDSHLHNVARQETPDKVPYICKKYVQLLQRIHLLFSFCRGSIQQLQRALLRMRVPLGESPSDFSATSASNFHCGSMSKNSILLLIK
jgi:hypothetical protein